MHYCQELVTSSTLNFHVTTPLICRIQTRVFSVRCDLSIILSCCNLHRSLVLVEVIVFGSTGKRPHTLTTRVCGDYCKYQVSSEKGRQNMGFLKKIKFWKKNTNTPTMVDACVSTEDPRTCDAATVSMDPTVVCCLHTDRGDQDGWWCCCCETGV
jgi:hypothetical protein